ncbi:hypothetical protein [Mycolicibacterium sp. 018/SC-01/001]|uniref:hypothetical protein n=1 Tax=Mycolicibacterium sp. 018/SC-01/001 TaxID=2592069 RepID=UPI002107AF7D|nr:hypothetical protein [Mycolicibacterium sp. 018/SC-01/001]
MYPDVVWQDEVDVVCTDVGPAGLLCAIAAAARGGEVMLAAQRPHSRTWFETVRGDAATSAYMAALVDDIDVKALPEQPRVLPVRSVRPVESAPAGRRRQTVPPFDGGRLRRWTGECIASPLGYLYTRVTDWQATPVRSVDGDIVEVCGVDVSDGAVGESGGLDEWLAAQIERHDLTPQPVDAVERLVFDDSTVSGVVFATGDGPLAVRARHGVLLCGPRGTGLPTGDAGSGQVALVGRSASRFGRVELLTDA